MKTVDTSTREFVSRSEGWFRTEHSSKARPRPAFLFDRDGTLIDSVYQHVLAWREALESEDIHLAGWYIHRRIGMSCGLIIHALFREAGRQLDPKEIARLQSASTSDPGDLNMHLAEIGIRGYLRSPLPA